MLRLTNGIRHSKRKCAASVFAAEMFVGFCVMTDSIFCGVFEVRFSQYSRDILV